MLLNMTNTLPDVVAKMQEAEFQFHLTGSRYWGNHTEKSDWDFFVQDCPSVREYLTTLGFTRYSKHSDYAADGQCVDVWVHGPTLLNEGLDRYGRFGKPTPDDLRNQVHVQCVLDFKAKQAVQEELFRMFPKGFRDKSEARRIWMTAFELIKFGNMCGASLLDDRFATFMKTIRPPMNMGEVQTVAAFCNYLKTGSLQSIPGPHQTEPATHVVGSMSAPA